MEDVKDRVLLQKGGLVTYLPLCTSVRRFGIQDSASTLAQLRNQMEVIVKVNA